MVKDNIAVAATGGAFYIDILGIGDLTRGKIPVSLDTLSGITQLDSIPDKSIHQYLAVYLLSTFRNALAEISDTYSEVKITQLSDCAFLWSTDLPMLINAASKLMFTLIGNGILCRGGLGYGEILVPTANGVGPRQLTTFT